MKLTDNSAEQALLEQILEETKPRLPDECAHLHYLLSTPFRYRPYPAGSRFRRAGMTPGVWYGAEAIETAVAEVAFYRCLFYLESPATPFPDDASEFTAIQAELRASLSLDLTRPPFDASAGAWENPTNYQHCQTMAEQARDAGITLIRYRSVRDPLAGAAVAVMSCRVFARHEPSSAQRRTWRLRISRVGVQALQEYPPLRLDFPADVFNADSRLHAMIWDRPRARR